MYGEHLKYENVPKSINCYPGGRNPPKQTNGLTVKHVNAVFHVLLRIYLMVKCQGTGRIEPMGKVDCNIRHAQKKQHQF